MLEVSGLPCPHPFPRTLFKMSFLFQRWDMLVQGNLFVMVFLSFFEE